MRFPSIVALVVAAVTVTSCGGITTLSPTTPSAMFTAPSPAAPGAPLAAGRSLPISGTVRPLRDYAVPCWADRYACEIFDFSTHQEGPIAVTLTWEGDPRALRVQLYWVGGTLAHEDIGRDSPRISFVRPRMEAAAYRLRVVSLEPQAAIPFTLTVTY